NVPSPPVITGFSPDTGIVGDHVTDAQSLVISGTTEPGVKRVVVTDGAVFTLGVNPDAAGAWSLSTTVLPVGAYNFTATATNALGNVSVVSAPFHVAVVPPPPPVITGFSPDTGIVGDRITAAQALT